MVDPITLGMSLGLGVGGVYLLRQYWQQRANRLRTLALLEKYSSSSRIGLHQGRMRLLVSMPQVGDLPLAEQQAWRERESRRDRNHLELGLVHLDPRAAVRLQPLDRLSALADHAPDHALEQQGIRKGKKKNDRHFFT